MDDDGVRSELIGTRTMWLAACRARESLRQDRILDDPYAAHVADFRGGDPLIDRIHDAAEFAAVLRIVTIDELLQRAILTDHLHAVVSLGAGLDTRPYRLGLPSDLRWVELDRDTVFTYKALRLAHARPTCQVERVGVDVTDVMQRDATLDRVSGDIARGLMFTEDASDPRAPIALQALSTHIPAGIKWWMVDTPRPAGEAADLAHAERDFVEALCADAWQIADCRSLEDEALRLAPDRLRKFNADGDRPIGPELGAVWMLHRPSDGVRRLDWRAS